MAFLGPLLGAGGAAGAGGAGLAAGTGLGASLGAGAGAAAGATGLGTAAGATGLGTAGAGATGGGNILSKMLKMGSVMSGDGSINSMFSILQPGQEGGAFESLLGGGQFGQALDIADMMRGSREERLMAMDNLSRFMFPQGRM